MIFKPLSALATFLFLLHTCITLQLSFIDRVKPDALVITTYTAKNSEFIWLQEVTEQATTTPLRVFIRSHYKDFTTTIPYQNRLQDPDNDLELKAVDGQNLKCALFYARSENKYFIHQFPDQRQNQKQRLYLNKSMTSLIQNQTQQTLSFDLSTTCNRIIIDRLRVYVYTFQSEYFEDNHTLGVTSWSFYWDLAIDFNLTDTQVSGHDQLMDIVVTTAGDVYRMIAHSITEYFQGSFDSWYYYYQKTLYDTNMVYVISVQTVDYLVQVQSFLYNSSVMDQQSPINYLRILIFAWKQVDRDYNYTIIAIKSNEENYDQTNVISEQYERTKAQPMFVSSPNLLRAVVYGTRPNGEIFYDGFFYDFTQEVAKNINFPPSITKTKWSFSMSHQFLYGRTVNNISNKFNESAFIFAGENLYPYLEEQTIQDSHYNNNWKFSFIKPTSIFTKINFLDASMTVFHVHQSAERIYYRVQSIDSFSITQSRVRSSFFEMGFTIGVEQVESKTQVIAAEVGDRWIYAAKIKADPIDNLTQLNQQEYLPQIHVSVTSYDRQNRLLSTLTIKIFQTSQFILKPHMISKKLDCFYFIDPSFSSMDFYTTDGDNISYIGSIQDEMFQKISPRSSKQVKLAENCSFVQVFDKLYVPHPDQNVFIQKQIAPLSLSSTSFDSNFIFAIEGQALYHVKDSGIQNVYNYSFLRNNEILVSKDQTKLIIRTYEAFTDEINDNTTGQVRSTANKSYFLFKILILSYVEDEWVEIKFKNSYTDQKVTNFLSTLSISQNFQRVLLCYVLNTSEAQKLCLLSVINYVTQQSVQYIYQFDDDRYPIIFNLQNDFISIVDNQQFIKTRTNNWFNCKQNILILIQDQIILLNSFNVDCKLYSQNFYQKQIIQNSTSGDFYLLMKYINQTSVRFVNRTPTNLAKVQSYPESFNFKEHMRGFFIQNTTFYQCSPGCLSCQNFHFCSKCMSGYTLNIQIFSCIKCNGYCDTCDTNNLTACITCRIGFYYEKSSRVCEPCHSNCESCDGKSTLKCTSCKIGYFLNQNIERKKKKTCLNCPQNCDYCKNSVRCTVCQFGFSLSFNGSCIKCPLNCNKCDPIEVSRCLGCKMGFELVSVDEANECRKCPELCQTCVAGKCSKCREETIFDLHKNVCYRKCITPCINCSLTNPRLCTSCIVGYKLNGTKCISNALCSINASCITCPSGYALITNKCHECAIDDNCAECNANDPTKCTGCKEGYFLLNQNCQPCQTQNCLRCYAKTVCEDCRQGYFASQMNSSATICLKCAPNCKSCIESVTNCLSCVDDFKLTGSWCISTKIVTFYFRLNTNILKFTYEVYNLLIEQLAGRLNKTVSEIRVNSLKNGSVKVEGSIDSKNMTDQEEVLFILNSGLGPGALIAGQQILQSIFIGYTPIVETQEMPNQNIVLILSLTIPGTLIILGLIGLILYKKFLAPKKVIVEAGKQSDRSSTETERSQKKKKKSARKTRIAHKDIYTNKPLSTVTLPYTQ